MIKLTAVGTSEIRTELATLTPSQGIVFATALYMVIERGKPIPRARLAEIIWPEIDRAARSHRLRQTILQLKKLGFPVRADRDNLLIDPESVTTDLDHGDNDRADGGDARWIDFLPGYNPAFSSAFAEWLDGVRSVFQSAAVARLVRQINDARSRGDWQSVDLIAAKCLSLDAYNEEAVLAKAEAAAMRGSKRRAVSILDEYLSDLGDASHELRLPASILRRRVVDRVPDRPILLNADPILVGRETEMASLSRSFDEARSGKGSSVLLIGEAGIGKTRLSAELARFAELRGARVQRATCRRADVERPLSLFIDIVPQLRELPGALGCAPDTFAWLKRLTEFQQKPDALFKSLDAEVLFESIRAAVFDLLDSIAEEHCLLIVLDDLQWLDRASTKLIASMAEWCQQRRILFLLNSRPTPTAYLELVESSQVSTLHLSPLGPDASTALLKSVPVRPGDELDMDLVEWCVRTAEGNPFFLQELAHQWIETGLRYVAPPSVTRVLNERLSRLTPEALQILQTSAVLNDYATVDRVERILEYHPYELLRAVEELSKAAMLASPESQEMSAAQLQPRHDLLSAAALGRLSALSQAFLHRRAAEVLETDLAQESVSATLVWACATHRHHAGDKAKALSLRISCAEHLLELGLAHDACVALQKTMDFCSNDADRLRVTALLSRAFELDGQWNESIGMLRTCVTLASRSDPSAGEHNDYELAMLGARHHSALDYATLLEESLRCVNCEAASAKHRVGAAVLALKLSVDFGRTDYVEATYARVGSLLTLPEVSELHALEVETIYRTMRGDGIVPVADLEKLGVVARRLEGELGFSRALLMAATACRLSGRYEEGLQFVSRASEHAQANRFEAKRAVILLSAVMLHIAAGAFDKAEQCIREIESLPPSDSPKERNEILAHTARIALERGDYNGALVVFSKIDRVAPNFSPSRTGYYSALEIRIRLAEGAPQHVLRPLVARLEGTHEQMREVGAQDFEAESLFAALSELNEHERALRLVRLYLQTRRGRWPVPDRLRAAVNSAPACKITDVKPVERPKLRALSTLA